MEKFRSGIEIPRNSHPHLEWGKALRDSQESPSPVIPTRPIALGPSEELEGVEESKGLGDDVSVEESVDLDHDIYTTGTDEDFLSPVPSIDILKNSLPSSADIVAMHTHDGVFDLPGFIKAQEQREFEARWVHGESMLEVKRAHMKCQETWCQSNMV